jgi:hypothetical protein
MDGEKRFPKRIFKLEAAKQCKLKNRRVNTPGPEKLVRIIITGYTTRADWAVRNRP